MGTLETSMDFNIFRSIEPLIFPPAGPLLVILLGLIWRKRIVGFVILGALLLYFSSIPAATRLLCGYLESYPPVNLEELNAQAIVVLGSKVYHDAAEYGDDTVANLLLERTRYAAWLHKRSGIPILAAGGLAKGDSISEAQAMKDVLEKEFGAAVKWIENKSRSTFENGQYSARILKQSGIERIALVTHAYHMPRAVEVFERQGLEVTAAPTIYYGSSDRGITILDWIPSSSALFKNRLAIHEILGMWYYHILYFEN